MSHRFEALRQAVDQEVPVLHKLEAVLREQRDRLVARDVSGLLETLHEQAQLLDAVQHNDAVRRQAMASLARELSVEATSTLGDLCEQLSGEPQRQLRKCRAQLRTRVDRVRRLNRDNQRLIQHALDVVQGLVAALSGRAPSQPTYEENGLLRAHAQLHALVDRTT